MQPDDNNNLPTDVLEAVRAGRKIEAIKLLRESQGLSLREAKTVVDGLAGLEGSGGTPPPGVKVEGGAGALYAVLAAIVVAAIVLWHFLGD